MGFFRRFAGFRSGSWSGREFRSWCCDCFSASFGVARSCLCRSFSFFRDRLGGIIRLPFTLFITITFLLYSGFASIIALIRTFDVGLLRMLFLFFGNGNSPSFSPFSGLFPFFNVDLPAVLTFGESIESPLAPINTFSDVCPAPVMRLFFWIFLAEFGSR